MSKRILLAILSLAVATALVGVATYAWYTDTASSTGNRFTAGTMDLKVDGEDVIAPMSYDDVAPGWIRTKEYIISNVGDTYGEMTLTCSNFVDDPGTTPAPEASITGEPKADMGALMKIRVLVNDVEFYSGTLADFVSASHDLDGLFPVSWYGATSLKIEASVPDTVGNELMGDMASFDMALGLQSISESGGLP